MHVYARATIRSGLPETQVAAPLHCAYHRHTPEGPPVHRFFSGYGESCLSQELLQSRRRRSILRSLTRDIDRLAQRCHS